MLDAFPPAARSQAALVQLTGGGFASHLQHLHVSQMVRQGTVALDAILLRAALLRALLGVVLRLTAFHHARIVLLLVVGGTLLLNYDMGRFQLVAEIADHRTARDEPVVVDANHWLKVLYLLSGEHVERGATDKCTDRQGYRHLHYLRIALLYVGGGN